MCLKVGAISRQYPSICFDGLPTTTEASVWTADLWADIYVDWVLPIMKKCQQLNCDIQFLQQRNITVTSVICPTAAGWRQACVSGPSSSCLELYEELQADLPASALVPAPHTGCICYTVQWHAVPKRALDWTVGGGWMTQSRCPLPADSNPPHQCLHAELCICSRSHWALPEIKLSLTYQCAEWGYLYLLETLDVCSE